MGMAEGGDGEVAMDGLGAWRLASQTQTNAFKRAKQTP